jgi:hypothetical protein
LSIYYLARKVKREFRTTRNGKRSAGMRGEKHFPFRVAAEYYRKLGWTGTIPVTRWGTKAPLAKGVTGHNGVDPDSDLLAEFLSEFPTANIGIRLPWNVIGIDVDAYDGRLGADTIQYVTNRLNCPLPPTWRSTSRAPEDGTSGIYLYRAHRSRSQVWVTDLGVGSGVEIAQFHHRFATVSPSIHNTTGREYKWWWKEILTNPPRPDELPELPVPWNLYLLSSREYVASSSAVASGEVLSWFARVGGGEMCKYMGGSADMEAVKIRDAIEFGGLHDKLVAAVTFLCTNAAEGHRGLELGLSILEDAFLRSGRRRNLRSEWTSAVTTAMAKAASGPQEEIDVCSMRADDWRRIL